MKKKISPLDVKSLLNTIAVKRDEMAQEPFLNPEEETVVGLVTSITVFNILFRIFGVIINEKIKKRLEDMPIDCLKLYDHPLIKELLQRLKDLCDVFTQFANTPSDAPGGIFQSITNVTPEDLILDAIEDTLRQIRGVVSDLSFGKCGKVWGDILSDIFSLGLGIPPWVADTIRKVIDGTIDASIAIGGILERYNPQAAAAWAARAVIKSHQAQPQIVQNPGIDWGTVGMALGAVGVGILVVYTGGLAAGVLIGVIGGTAATALADIPPEQIQREVDERIKIQQQAVQNF